MTHPMTELAGIAASEGIAIGRAVCLEGSSGEVFRLPLREEEIEDERGRFRASVEASRREVRRTVERARRTLGDDLSAIFEAHGLLLEDSSFLDEIERRIVEERVNAEWAVHRTTESLIDRFEALDDPHLRLRSEDLRDVGGHLLRSLQGISHHELSEVEGDVVIVARDLTPSEAVRLGREEVVGFVLEGGGKTSHTAIIARSLSLPLICGVEGVTDQVTDEDPLVLDGTLGRVILHPSAAVLREYRERRARAARREKDLLATRDLEAVTRDGVAIELMANIDLLEELEDARRNGVRGIGLYRSEFLYIERSPELPSEADHLALYRRLLETMAPHPVVIRTFDLGGRKLARELLETEEDNPVLGLRGIRLTLARPEMFRSQLRALFRAASHGNLWVMLPMISSVDEIRRFRSFASEVLAELEREGIGCTGDYKLGIMIEVPSAAVVADRLALEVDFFSIGTNDLIQYALAVDRNNEHVSELYRPLHPAILRMIRFVVASAREAGIDVALCGEMAAEARYAPVLVALGLRRLSLSPRRAPAVKSEIRRMAIEEIEPLIERCLDLSSAAEVEALLAEHGYVLTPQDDPKAGVAGS